MKDDAYTIWPAYIDASKKRSQGRKISRKIAIENPTVREIYLVAQAFKYDPKINSSARYSRAWWEEPGYVKIIKKDKKNKALQKIALGIKKLRTRVQEKKSRTKK
ncbi:MAG: signal recognition particle subunit SRP19/SEC65 family protein [Promethearchaeota archaeon]